MAQSCRPRSRLPDGAAEQEVDPEPVRAAYEDHVGEAPEPAQKGRRLRRRLAIPRQRCLDPGVEAGTFAGHQVGTFTLARPQIAIPSGRRCWWRRGTPWTPAPRLLNIEAREGPGQLPRLRAPVAQEALSLEYTTDLLEAGHNVACGKPDLTETSNVGELGAPVFEHDYCS